MILYLLPRPSLFFNVTPLLSMVTSECKDVLLKPFHLANPYNVDGKDHSIHAYRIWSTCNHISNTLTFACTSFLSILCPVANIPDTSLTQVWHARLVMALSTVASTKNWEVVKDIPFYILKVFFERVQSQPCSLLNIGDLSNQTSTTICCMV